MVGLKARSTLVPAETYVREFIPYGTPCEEACEPTAQRIDELEARLAMFHAELEKMRPEDEPLPEPETAPARSRKRSGSHS
jgi:serine O-acetyltransferase